MRGVRLLGLVVAACLGAASGAAAQTVRLYPYPSTGDSAVVILTGDSAQALLYFEGGGVSYYDITLFLDDTRVQFARADTVGTALLPPPTVTVGSGTVRFVASGTGANTYYTPLLRLTFRLPAGAQEGSLLSLRGDSLVGYGGTTNLTATHRTLVLNACQATQMWGDLDATRTVTSRDALIALTHAVGLPTPGFDVTIGDVDEDVLTTSRDALIILTKAVALYDYYYRAGKPRANRCGPLVPVSRDVAFWRSNALWRVPAGDTVPVYTGVTSPSGASYGWGLSWAPDGSRVLFTEYFGSPYYEYGFLAVSPDGAVRDTILLQGSYYDFEPSWSPDGTRIAFVSYRAPDYLSSLWVMDADGANLVRLTDTISVDQYYSRPDWSPDGSRIVFRGYRSSGGPWQLLTVNADGTGLAEAFANSASPGPVVAAWSPAGDSLAYRGWQYMIYRVAAGGADSGVTVSRLAGSQDFPSWLPAGVSFQGGVGATYAYLQITPAGRTLMHFRSIPYNSGYVARRNTVYVNSVTVTPGSVTIGVESSQELTVTVLSNLGAAIVPGSGIRCSSSDEAVAVVVVNGSQNCVVTGVGLGTATITATAGGWRSGTASATVQ